MSNSARDNNRVTTKIGVLNTDGTTVKKLYANPSTHIIRTNDGTGGSDFGGDDAVRDLNGEPVKLAV